MKTKHLAILILLFLWSCGPGDEDRFPFKDIKTELWGYVNQDFDVIIEPQFHEAQPFKEGYAVVRKDGDNYIIDAFGRERINPEYDNKDYYIRSVEKGWFIALLSEITGEYILIDHQGEKRIPSDELKHKYPHEIIDDHFISGSELYSVDNEMLKNFRVQDNIDESGYLLGYKTSDKSIHIIDFEGNAKVSAQEGERFYPVANGMFLKTWTGEDSTEHAGFCYAKNGKLSWEFDPSYYERSDLKRMGYSKDGLVRMERSKQTFYYDKDGDEKLILDGTNYGHFNNGLATITISRNENRYTGFIDRSGEVVFEPLYTDVQTPQGNIISASNIVIATKRNEYDRTERWYVNLETGKRLLQDIEIHK